MIPTSPTELKSLNGLVERVTYHNPENGYCVLRVKVRGLRERLRPLWDTPARFQ